VERIDFCEVLKDPRQYSGKEITVRATYEYWFEVSNLYCLSCLDRGRTWLSISSDLDRDSENEWRKAPESGLVHLTVTGELLTGGTLGHLNGCQHEFAATKVRKSGGSGERAAIAGAKETNRAKWACGGRSPK
jgi:hypothetical protein